MKHLGSCVLKASTVEYQSISSINPLDQPSINTWSILNQHIGWYLINTWLTSQSTASRKSTNFCTHAIECWSIHWVGRHSADHRPTVDQVSIKMLIKCWPNVSQVSTEMSIKCPLRCQSSVDWGLIDGINRHSTVDHAFITHNPAFKYLKHHRGNEGLRYSNSQQTSAYDSSSRCTTKDKATACMKNEMHTVRWHCPGETHYRIFDDLISS